MTIGQTVRAKREAAEMTQENLAYKAGVALSTVQRIERGGEPSLDAMRRIAIAFGVPIGDLLGEQVAS